MAEKRMFTKKITDSDAFIELPSAAQALYFHLNQSADDDGFNNQVQLAMLKAHASIDDLKVLLIKNFIIRFESGVIVIKHWRMHNTLRKDRYVPTNFQEELAMLGIKENGAYTTDISEVKQFESQTVAKRLPDGCQVVAERLPDGCLSIDKYSKEYCANSQSSLAQNTAKDSENEQVSLVEELFFDENTMFDYEDKVQKFDQEAAFNEFWKHYPKKTNKANAKKSFNKKCKSEEMLQTMIEAIEKQKDSKQWQEANGQYIPHPSTWLNGERWEDELEPAQEKEAEYMPEGYMKL